MNVDDDDDGACVCWSGCSDDEGMSVCASCASHCDDDDVDVEMSSCVQ